MSVVATMAQIRRNNEKSLGAGELIIQIEKKINKGESIIMAALTR